MISKVNKGQKELKSPSFSGSGRKRSILSGSSHAQLIVNYIMSIKNGRDERNLLKKNARCIIIHWQLILQLRLSKYRVCDYITRGLPFG